MRGERRKERGERKCEVLFLERLIIFVGILNFKV